MFLEPGKSERAGEFVRHAIGEGTFEVLTAFLAFVRTAHYWTETHPKFAIEPAILAVLEKHDRLAGCFSSFRGRAREGWRGPA